MVPRLGAMNALSKNKLLLAVKLALLGLFLYGTNQGLIDRVRDIGLQLGLVVFSAVWLMALLALVAVAFTPKRGVRVLWTIPLVACSMFSLTFHLITAGPMTLSEFERLVGLFAFFDNVLGSYGNLVIAAGMWSWLGAIALNMPPFQTFSNGLRTLRVLRHAGALQFAPVIAISLILYSRGGMGSNGMPVQYVPMAFAAVVGVERMLVPPVPPRAGVALAHTGRAPLGKIIVIMDESIRGDFLDVNASTGVRSNLLQAGDSLVNFGVASSQANCSEESNVSLRYGATKANYLRDLSVNPSIWEYAKKAGYSTTYVDAQRHNGNLQNFMTDLERSHIDRFIQLDEQVTPAQRDLEIARRLRQFIDEPAANFMYVNKMGCHFPYAGKYPEAERRFTPSMDQTYFGNRGDLLVSRPFGDKWGPQERLRFVNSYKNCVGWNVGKFFELLLSGADLRNTLIVYTSDHGQDFHEDGRPGFATHCGLGRVALK